LSQVNRTRCTISEFELDTKPPAKIKVIVLKAIDLQLVFSGT